ncbi:oligosaccharide flippase family protein [Candidatus Nomurabacteria bacterium]|nr:oligosaccharide flippase family protein [Candidatus Nomurabacteria bacterium]
MSFLKRVFIIRDSVSVVALLLFLTKILGFIKFRMIASLFGASGELDIFWAAFIVPDTLFNILVAGSLNASIIPVFSDILTKDGEKKLLKLFIGTSFITVLISAALILVLFITADDVSRFLVSSGYIGTFLSLKEISNSDIELLSSLMKIMLLSPLLLGISSVITGFLQVHRKFFITTVSPLVYNVGIIFGAKILVENFGLGVKGLAWAVIIGSVLHFLIQLPLVLRFITESLDIHSLKRIGGSIKYYTRAIFRIFTLAVPRAVSYLGEQFNVGVNTIISLSLTEGALSAYKFAISLHLFPVHVFGGAVAQVSLPDFSELYSKGKLVELRASFNKALRRTLFIIFPSVAIIVVLRLPLVRLAYGVGQFDWWDTVVTSWALALLGPAIIGQAVVALALRVLYSAEETKWPLIATFVTAVVNIMGSYYFTNFFSHYLDWRPIISQIGLQLGHAFSGGEAATVIATSKSLSADLGKWFTTRNVYDAAVGGLSLSLSLAFMVEMVINMWFVHLKVRAVSWKETVKPNLVMAIAATIMGIVMYFLFRLTDFSLDTTRTIQVAILFVVTSFAGIVTYLLLCYAFGVKEIEILYSRGRALVYSVLRRS